MTSIEYHALLESLRDLASHPNGEDFNRANLIALIEVLASHLGEALATKVGELEGGTLVQAEHPVVSQLSGLASALRDLDAGLTDPVLKRTLSKKTAARPWHVRQQDQTLIEAVEVFGRLKRIKSVKGAANKVATELNRQQYTRRGKRLRGSDIYNIINKYK